MSTRTLSALTVAAALLTLALPGSALAQSNKDRDRDRDNARIQPVTVERPTAPAPRTTPAATGHGRSTGPSPMTATPRPTNTTPRSLSPDAQHRRQPAGADRMSRLNPPRGWGEPDRWIPGSERALWRHDVRNRERAVGRERVQQRREMAPRALRPVAVQPHELKPVDLRPLDLKPIELSAHGPGTEELGWRSSGRRNEIGGAGDDAIIELPIERTHPTPRRPAEPEPEPETPEEPGSEGPAGTTPTHPGGRGTPPVYQPFNFDFGPIYGSRYAAFRECGYTGAFVAGYSRHGLLPGYTGFSATRFGHAVLNGYGILGWSGPNSRLYGESNCASPINYSSIRSFEHSQGIWVEECAEITLHAGTELEESFSVALPQLGVYNVLDLSSRIARKFEAGETISLWKPNGERVRIAPAAGTELIVGRCAAE